MSEYLRPESYERIKGVYWVAAFKDERDSAYWFGWKAGTKKPKQMPNLQMHWRRPTYQEANRRHEAAQDRENFQRCVERYGR